MAWRGVTHSSSPRTPHRSDGSSTRPYSTVQQCHAVHVMRESVSFNDSKVVDLPRICWQGCMVRVGSQPDRRDAPQFRLITHKADAHIVPCRVVPFIPSTPVVRMADHHQVQITTTTMISSSIVEGQGGVCVDPQLTLQSQPVALSQSNFLGQTIIQ